MGSFFCVMVVLFFLVGSHEVHAADKTVPLVNNDTSVLAALIADGVTRNPSLRALKCRVEAAQERASLFRNIPDPVVEYEYDRILPSALAMSDSGKIRPMKSLAISQDIPFPTKIWMRKQSARKEANALEQDYKEKEQTLIKEIRTAYYKLYLYRRKVGFLNDSMSLMRQFIEVMNKKYAANRAVQQDVLRSQVEYSRLINTMTLYRKESTIAQDLLISLLGGEDDRSIDHVDLDTVKAVELKEADIVALVKKSRPELKSAREMLDKARIESSLSKQEFIPDVSLKYKRDEKDGKFSRIGDGEWSGMIGINVPIWFWGKQRSEVRETMADLQAATADYQAVENAAVFEAKAVFAQYQAAQDLVATYETGILPQAESAVITARRAYESGSLSFTDLLGFFRMQRDLQMEYVELVSDLQISRADLDRVVGGNLE